MAPRAGFEVDRKVLSAHVATCVDELSTPARTPLRSNLEFCTWASAGICLQAGRTTRYRAVQYVRRVSGNGSRARRDSIAGHSVSAQVLMCGH
jgi:hypothetical protein